MRCKQIREALESLETREVPAVIREHVTSCPDCRAYARDSRLVGYGFRALAEQKVPEASIGFVTRLVRRLGENRSRSPAEFLEEVGRRVVFATFLLTLVMLLSLAIPSAGPVRGAATADLYLGQAEAMAAETDPILAPDVQGRLDAVPSNRPNAKGNK